MPSYNNITLSTLNYANFSRRFSRVNRVSLVVNNAPIFAQFAVISRDTPTINENTVPFEEGVERDMQNGLAYTWDAERDFNGLWIVGIQCRAETLSGALPFITVHAGA